MSTPTQAGTDTLERTHALEELTGAPSWQVVLWNDPVNLLEYVTSTLMRVLGLPRLEAESLMLLAHIEGKAPVFEGARQDCETIANKLMAATLWATLEKL